MANGRYICSDNNGTSIIKGFNCLKISVKRKSRVIAAPVESGQKSFDNKVIDPKEVHVTGVVTSYDDTDTVSKLNSMFANRKFEFYSVLSDNEMYNNLILQDCPDTITSEKPDFKEYELVFVEALLVQSRGASPANAQNSNTVASGNVQMRKV